jgi:hypothetical protein
MLKVAEQRITLLTGPDENGEITLTKTTVQELS